MVEKANYITCTQGHKVYVIWSDLRECFGFTCDECGQHSESAISVHGRVRVQLVDPPNRADADPFDHADVKAFFRRAESEMFPRMKESAASITIFGKPDPKLCMELGAALLFDKPIIVMVPDGRGPVPANLKRCASAIVEGSMDDPALPGRLQEALAGVLKHDRRAQ